MKPSELLRLVWINITQNKFKTIIGNDVFVGSDTQLVAPVTVADGYHCWCGDDRDGDRHWKRWPGGCGRPV